MTMASSAETAMQMQVASWAARSRPWPLGAKVLIRPARIAPINGMRTAKVYMRLWPSALHQIDVFDRDRAAVAEVDDEDGEADGGLGGGHGQNQHGEDLAHQVAEMRREGDQVDVDGEQHELDRHQDDDDVLAVEEHAEDAQREDDGGDGQVMGKADLQHHTPPRVGTLTSSTDCSRVRLIWREMSWRRTPSRSR